jgi:hypothetical protein
MNRSNNLSSIMSNQYPLKLAAFRTKPTGDDAKRSIEQLKNNMKTVIVISILQARLLFNN